MEQEISWTEKVAELKSDLAEAGVKEVKWFIGEMHCSKCNSTVKVRFDVYLKRVLTAKENGFSEEQMNAQYVCRNCAGSRTVKKKDFYAMLEKMKAKK